MSPEEIRIQIHLRVKKALVELNKEDPDMMVVRDKLCDAAQFTHFRTDGTRTDQL
jgi:hypothetical protein